MSGKGGLEPSDKTSLKFPMLKLCSSLMTKLMNFCECCLFGIVWRRIWKSTKLKVSGKQARCVFVSVLVTGEKVQKLESSDLCLSLRVAFAQDIDGIQLRGCLQEFRDIVCGQTVLSNSLEVCFYSLSFTLAKSLHLHMVSRLLVPEIPVLAKMI